MSEKKSVSLRKDPELQKALSIIIRKFRKDLGLSQEKLAFRTNFTRNYIYYLERGEHSISLVALYSFAQAFEMTPAKFFAEIDKVFQDIKKGNL